MHSRPMGHLFNNVANVTRHLKLNSIDEFRLPFNRNKKKCKKNPEKLEKKTRKWFKTTKSKDMKTIRYLLQNSKF